MKNRRTYAFPLGALAQSLLSPPTEFQSKFIFPARGKTSSCFNGWSKSKRQFDNSSGITDWTLHDLRRTFATNLAQLGVAPHVIERLLNHVTGTISGVAAICNRAKYFDEMALAVQQWESRLVEILNA